MDSGGRGMVNNSILLVCYLFVTYSHDRFLDSGGSDYHDDVIKSVETFSALLTLCSGNSPVTGEFPAPRPVTRSFDVFFDLRLNKRLSKHPRRWWFAAPSRPLWRHCNDGEWWHFTCLLLIRYISSLVDTVVVVVDTGILLAATKQL